MYRSSHKSPYTYPLDARFFFLHYLLASVLGYFMFLKWTTPEIALLGAISIAYAGSAVKIQESCIVYTLCWIPGIFIGGWVGTMAAALGFLGGYWPILLYFVPLMFYVLGWKLFLVVLAISSIQIIPFLWYWPKTIHFGRRSNIGKFPLWKLIDLFKGDTKGYKINGVFAFELACYVGFMIPVLAVFSHSRFLIIAVLSLLLSMSFSAFRIPARGLHLACFSMIWCAMEAFSRLGLSQEAVFVFILVKGFCLLKNADMYPLTPFNEPIRTPKEHFYDDICDVSKFPHFTGYVHELNVRPYTGGFCLKETAERFGMTDPEGSRD